MMYYLEGNLSTNKRYPYLYLLLKDEYIYIGETSRPNYTRLTEHLVLGKNGDKSGFRENLKIKDPDVEKEENIPIKYYSVGISEYFTFNIQQLFTLKEFLVLIEADLHNEFKKRRNEIQLDFHIISSTVRTNPIPSKKITNLIKTREYREIRENVFIKFIAFINKEQDKN